MRNHSLRIIAALLLVAGFALGLRAPMAAGAVGAYDGVWSGTTGQGRGLTFDVTNNAIPSLEVEYALAGCASTVTATFNPPHPIAGSSFAISLFTGLARIEVAGTFQSAAAASGTLKVQSSDAFCRGTLTTSWTATNGSAPAPPPAPGPGPSFPDVPPSHPYYQAITELAAQGIIRGYQDGRFGPNDPTLRAQMAALIARAMGWDAERWPNPFPDRGSVDADLRRNVGTLNHYDVARGYPDGTYKPTVNVLYAQSISFIARAMVAKGFWAPQPDNPALYPNVPAGSGHREDIATYVYYAGAIPATVPMASWGEWDQPSTRGWFAQALWQALTSR